MCDLLSLIDLSVKGESVAPTTDQFLRTVADMMWTMVIMFACLFKLVPSLTAPDIEKPDEAQSYLNMICLQTCLYFLLFFTSRWF